MCLSVYICLFISPSVYLYFRLSMYLSIYLSMCLSISLSIHLFVYLFIHISNLCVCVCVCPPIYPSIYESLETEMLILTFADTHTSTKCCLQADIYRCETLNLFSSDLTNSVTVRLVLARCRMGMFRRFGGSCCCCGAWSGNADDQHLVCTSRGNLETCEAVRSYLRRRTERYNSDKLCV